MEKRVALFFGSFNPLHIGHLMLGNYIAEFTDVEEVRFIVSPQSPLKKEDDLLDDSMRFEMVCRSISEYSKFSASNVEFLLPKPSFTCETLSFLSKKEPDTQFILVMGGDNLDIFHKWKNYEWIMAHYPVFVYPRLNSSNRIPEYFPNVRMINAPVIELSSTFIRQSLKAGKDVRFFLPESVSRMIEEYDLYK